MQRSFLILSRHLSRYMIYLDKRLDSMRKERRYGVHQHYGSVAPIGNQ